MNGADGREHGEVNLSAITLAELRFGIAASHRRTLNLAKLELFLASFEVVAFDDRAAKVWKLDRLARSRKQLAITMEEAARRAHGRETVMNITELQKRDPAKNMARSYRIWVTPNRPTSALASG